MTPITFPVSDVDNTPVSPSIPSYTLTPIIHAQGNWIVKASSNPGNNKEYNFLYLEKDPDYLAMSLNTGRSPTIFFNATNTAEIQEFACENPAGVILQYVDIYNKDQYNKILCKSSIASFKEVVDYADNSYVPGATTATIKNQYLEFNNSIGVCKGLVFENCIISIDVINKNFSFLGCTFKNTYITFKNGYYISDTPDERYKEDSDKDSGFSDSVINKLHYTEVDTTLNITFEQCVLEDVILQGLLAKEIQFINCDFVEDTVSVKGCRIDKFVLDVRSFKTRPTDTLFIKASYINKVYWRKFDSYTTDDRPLTNRFTIYNSSVGKIMYDPLISGYTKPSSVTISGFTITALYSKASQKNNLDNGVSIVWINPDSDSNTKVGFSAYVNSDPLINIEITTEKLKRWLKDYYVSFYKLPDETLLPIKDETIGKMADKLYESYELIIATSSDTDTDVEVSDDDAFSKPPVFNEVEGDLFLPNNSGGNTGSSKPTTPTTPDKEPDSGGETTSGDGTSGGTTTPSGGGETSGSETGGSSNTTTSIVTPNE